MHAYCRKSWQCMLTLHRVRLSPARCIAARPVRWIANQAKFCLYRRVNDVTQLLASIEQGDPIAAEQLLPLVYEELRKLAAARMAQEWDTSTLQPTALVHEAW